MVLSNLSLIARFLIAACIFYGSSRLIHAQETDSQEIDYIKRSNGYYWGEGQGTTRDDAQRMAITQLARSIAASAKSTTSISDSTTIVNGIRNSVSQKSTASSVSSDVFLTGYETITLATEPNAKVFCYISKADYREQKKRHLDRIRDYVKTAVDAEQKLQLDDALRYFYWALMYAKLAQDKVMVDVGHGDEIAEAALPVKINAVLNQIKASVVSSNHENNKTTVQLCFEYGGHKVSTLAFRYSDGQDYIGPVNLRDGEVEIELLHLPTDSKLDLQIEYQFRDDARHTGDDDLRQAFQSLRAPLFPTSALSLPVKVTKSGEVEQGRKEAKLAAELQQSRAEDAAYPTPEVKDKPIIHVSKLDGATFQPAVNLVADAIRQRDPSVAFSAFTPDGYRLFETLLNSTGRVSLERNKANLEFIDAGRNILARHVNINIKFRSGASFKEKLVLRFDKQSGKIESVALGLTDIAEQDIFKASVDWNQISRFTILQFMEDYQTAYALKRLDYIKSIFSDDAYIITGAVLQKTKADRKFLEEGQQITLGKSQQRVSYRRFTKDQYIRHLSQHFRDREFIHLTFEKNVSHMIDTQGHLHEGDVFGIQISQTYRSPVYSDRGCLTLMLNMTGEYPLIEVRLWQPEDESIVDMDDFFSSENFAF